MQMVEEYSLITGVVVELLPTFSCPLLLKYDLGQVICLNVLSASVCLNNFIGKMKIMLVPNLYDCNGN